MKNPAEAGSVSRSVYRPLDVVHACRWLPAQLDVTSHLIGGEDGPHLTMSFKVRDLTWEAVFVGVVLLALPQVPLTLGNAVIAPVEFNN
jgi:hypothetical protein